MANVISSVKPTNSLQELIKSGRNIHKIPPVNDPHNGNAGDDAASKVGVDQVTARGPNTIGLTDLVMKVLITVGITYTTLTGQTNYEPKSQNTQSTIQQEYSNLEK